MASSSSTSANVPSIDAQWPSHMLVGCGMLNTGNSSYLNSVLQILMHTAPVLNKLVNHNEECKSILLQWTDTCDINLYPSGRRKRFCMLCALARTMDQSHSLTSAFEPKHIIDNLHRTFPNRSTEAKPPLMSVCIDIANRFRKGEQQDAHEFFLHVLKAMQKSSLGLGSGW